MDSYFSGIDSITNGLEMIKEYPELRSLSSKLKDLFGQMPIISKLFSSNVASSITSYHSYIGRSDLICPLLVQSIAHFSKLFAPVLSMLFAFISMAFNKMLNSVNGAHAKFVLVSMVFCCSLFMELNTVIILQSLWIRLFYLFVLAFNIPLKAGYQSKREASFLC